MTRTPLADAAREGRLAVRGDRVVVLATAAAEPPPGYHRFRSFAEYTEWIWKQTRARTSS